MGNATVGSELVQQLHEGTLAPLPSAYLAQTRDDLVAEIEEVLDVGARIRPLKIGDRQVGWARGVHLSERRLLRRWVADEMDLVAHMLRLGTSLTDAEIDDLSLSEMRSLSRVVKAMTDSDMRLYPFLHAFSTTSISEQLWHARGSDLASFTDRRVRLPDGKHLRIAAAPDHARLWALLCANRIASKARLDANFNALLIIRPWVGKNAESLSADLKRTSRMLQTDSMEPWREVIRATPETHLDDGWAHSATDDSLEGMQREMRGMMNNDRHERVMAAFERQERERAEEEKRRVEQLLAKRRAELERPSGMVVLTEEEVATSVRAALRSRHVHPVVDEETQSSLADRLARYQ